MQLDLRKKWIIIILNPFSPWLRLPPHPILQPNPAASRYMTSNAILNRIRTIKRISGAEQAMGSTKSNPSSANPGQPAQVMRHILIVCLTATAIYYVFRSWNWALMVDSPIMHYVVFLIHHGLKPYKDISDNNMPGAYIAEAAAMRLFGTSDLAWRVYEFFLLAVLTLAMTIIAATEDWVAGIFAGGTFLALHAAEGPRFAVEREEVIAVLLMLGCAAMFTAVRRQRPPLLLLMGLAGGIAFSIKPTYLPLLFTFMVIMTFALRHRRVNPTFYLAYALAGLAVAVVLDLSFLLHYGVLRQFIFITRIVTPVYHGESHPIPLILHSVPKYLIPAFLLGAICLAANLRRNERWNWERWSLLAGAAFGLLSYFIQGKGFEHHRYPYLVFALLLTGLEALRAARTNGWPSWCSAGTIVAVVFFALPIYVYTLHNLNNTSILTLTLEDDLQHLNQAQSLQDKVQCFDLVSGCLNALYHLRLVENAGFTGDLLFFRPESSIPRNYYRDLYWRLAQQDPGTVLVVGNESFGQTRGFNKLDNWPEFRTYLDQNYTEVIDRQFPMEDVTRGGSPREPGDIPAYRIYIRNRSPLLEAARRLAN